MMAKTTCKRCGREWKDRLAFMKDTESCANEACLLNNMPNKKTPALLAPLVRKDASEVTTKPNGHHLGCQCFGCVPRAKWERSTAPPVTVTTTPPPVIAEIVRPRQVKLRVNTWEQEVSSSYEKGAKLYEMDVPKALIIHIFPKGGTP